MQWLTIVSFLSTASPQLFPRLLPWMSSVYFRAGHTRQVTRLRYPLRLPKFFLMRYRLCFWNPLHYWGSLEHSLRISWEDPVRLVISTNEVSCIPGVLESYLQGQGSPAAPKAPLGQELLGIHVVLGARTVLAVPKVLGGLADL